VAGVVRGGATAPLGLPARRPGHEDPHEYTEIKTRLSAHHPSDRVAYTKAKSDFVRRVTEEAKAFYEG
jgi:GrpB-like predicted nucleotidyltransferase (UPF0157 family)